MDLETTPIAQMTEEEVTIISRKLTKLFVKKIILTTVFVAAAVVAAEIIGRKIEGPDVEED